MIIRAVDLVDGESVTLNLKNYRISVARMERAALFVPTIFRHHKAGCRLIAEEPETCSVCYEINVRALDEDGIEKVGRCGSTWEVPADLNLEIKEIVPLDAWDGDDCFDTWSAILSIDGGSEQAFLQYNAESKDYWNLQRKGEANERN